MAEELRHTPGPWRYEAGVVKAGAGYQIAEIKLQAGATMHNAHLLAAAPDMLAALKLVQAMNFLKHGDESKVVAAAIAKATDFRGGQGT